MVTPPSSLAGLPPTSEWADHETPWGEWSSADSN